MSIILLVDGLPLHYAGTAGRVQVTLSLAVLTLGSIALLAACGGGGNDDASGADSTVLNSFSLNALTISAPTIGALSYAAQWSASASGPLAANNYWVQAFVVPVGSSASAKTEANQILNRNCNPMAPCKDPHTEACNFNSNRVLSCSFGRGRQLAAGTYTVIAEACHFNSALDKVCSATKESKLTVQ
ncbi:hypothetical protein [Paucibacter sp. KCTC 42545]|uniref:hypothetical protein n=1 Tax=Paucibacter sp. KCTC 42545 TaxID=1768242 RepID=UPI000733BB80|nr:hypothetical protein [Paucibacter sp. KCTC 42545]ALT78531.1 hypothetical protein AT984_16370 [Paucibacter sp. KCTC 42545]